MDARLRAGQYEAAMQFASNWMTKDPSYGRTMGSLIKQESERLLNESDESTTMLENAIKLVQGADKLTPALPVDQHDVLKQVEDDARRKLEKIKGGTYVAPDPIHLNPADTATAKGEN
jgi:hypothetical protein